MSAAHGQVGGVHYQNLTTDPYEFAIANDLGGLELSVVKYVSRWPDKGGVEDVRKARDTVNRLKDGSEVLKAARHGRPMPTGMTPDEYCIANQLGRHESSVVFWTWLWHRNRLDCALDEAGKACDRLIEQIMAGGENAEH